MGNVGIRASGIYDLRGYGRWGGNGSRFSASRGVRGERQGWFRGEGPQRGGGWAKLTLPNITLQ